MLYLVCLFQAFMLFALSTNQHCGNRHIVSKEIARSILQLCVNINKPNEDETTTRKGKTENSMFNTKNILKKQ